MKHALGRFGPAALALAGGGAAALAHPPFALLPLLFGHAAVLLALEAPARGRWGSGFRRGWAAGTGYLAVSTLWIAEPFLIDAQAHAWQIPFAMAGMAGGIGLLWGVGGLLYRALTLRGAGPGGRVLAYTTAFALAEWLRGNILTGFPWDLPGETFRAGSALSQGAALVGAYGMTPLVLFVAAAPAALWRARDADRAWLTPTAAVALVAGLGVWGAARVAAAPSTPHDAPMLRIVQPDLPEPPAWSSEVLDRALDRYTRLSAAPPEGRPPDWVIWPEGALPASLNEALNPQGPILPVVASAVRPGALLFLGGARGEASGTDARWFNTLAVLRREPAALRTVATYDKHHLVPFGEYLPWPSVLGGLGLRKMISVAADFSPGPPPRPVRLPNGRWVQPLICYEALFPGLAAGDGRVRPSALVNISDDAWFGRGMGPWQHLNIASYRAIEEGLPMVRSTPTGVSAVIDAFGRPLRLLAPGRAGVIDAPLPTAQSPTPYSRLRQGPFWLMQLLAAVACLCRPADVKRFARP